MPVCVYERRMAQHRGKVPGISMTSKDARKFSRFFFAGAAALELDKQGRILLPPVLREYADLQKMSS